MMVVEKFLNKKGRKYCNILPNLLKLIRLEIIVQNEEGQKILNDHNILVVIPFNRNNMTIGCPI